MKKLLFLLSASLLVLFVPAFEAMAQAYKVGSPDAAALAMEFHSGDSYRIAQALLDLPYYEDVYEDNTLFVDVDPYVEKGIISALDSQLDVYFSWDLAEGKEFFFEDVITPLAVYLTRIDDPDAIPVLLRAIEISAAARIALAEFGPDVVPLVIDHMNSSECTIDYIISGFFALATIVRFWRPLDAEMHTTLRQLAIDYIQGYIPEHLIDDPQSYGFKFDGSYLASVLGDTDLKPMVAALSSYNPILIEGYLQNWYDPDTDAADRDQIDFND